jgi:hypothetical protein
VVGFISVVVLSVQEVQSVHVVVGFISVVDLSVHDVQSVHVVQSGLVFGFTHVVVESVHHVESVHFVELGSIHDVVESDRLDAKLMTTIKTVVNCILIFLRLCKQLISYNEKNFIAYRY